MSRSSLTTILAATLGVGLLGLGCVVLGTDADYGGGSSWRLPPGSYRESCRYLVVDGHRLKGQCRTDRGQWRSASLDLRACNRDIVNEDGRLRCGASSYSRIPAGSYQRSCRNIRVRRGALLAECRTQKGRWREASAPADACRRFANRNAKLVCE